jgi:hypothetical protein
MSDIVSSLEHEFANHSQAERESHIAQLRQIESKGRGRLDVRPHAIMIPLLFGGCGGLLMFAAFQAAQNNVIVFLIGLALVVPNAWAMFGPRKPRFTLTEEGVRVKAALLPWDSIEDFSVTESSTNGFSTHTSVVLTLVPGFTPPKLDLFFLFGSNSRHRKTGQYSTRLTLHAGAKGMNVDKLAGRIGEFRAATLARAELARLQAG